MRQNHSNRRLDVQKSRQGFTLVELLVVVLILLILVTLLVPSLETSMESGRTVLCANRQRTLRHWETVYSDHNDGWVYYDGNVDGDNGWKSTFFLAQFGQMPDNARDCYMCPSDTPYEWTGSKPQEKTFGKEGTYVQIIKYNPDGSVKQRGNANFSGPDLVIKKFKSANKNYDVWYWKMSWQKSPSKTRLWYDTTSQGSGEGNQGPGGMSYPSLRHLNTLNIVALDYHIDTFTVARMFKEYKRKSSFWAGPPGENVLMTTPTTY